MTPPTATYRLQMHAGFGFADAKRALPYLRTLGISHLYLSPILAARPGSSHGYDVVDATRLNPEIGTEPELRELAGTAHELGMKVVLDIVPNHMAAAEANRWWMDVLERGRRSRHARVFDIDWDAFDGKVLVPILGAPYGEVLANGDLEIARGEGRLWIRYHENRLPVNGRSCERALGKAADDVTPDDIDEINGDHDTLHALLEAQHYRLAWWRAANRMGNYRRFFDVTELVSLHAEDPRVFEDTHRYVIKLVRAGLIDALRIDHIDGLHDPQAYLDRLALRTDRVPVYVEKILGPDERIPTGWATEGTTGYEFIQPASDVFIDPQGVARLRELLPDLPGFRDAVRRAKHHVLAALFASEVAALMRRLVRIARADLSGRDIGEQDLKEALVEVTAAMRVYRTYVRGPDVPDDDRARIEEAVSTARTHLPPGGYAALDLLASVLLDPHDEERIAFVMRWQQLSGPAAAKGFEDTTLYRYTVLMSRNEVGGEPGAPVGDVEAFHTFNQARVGRRDLSASSTHDTKRGEDVRARIDVLSELAEEWADEVERWRAFAARAAADIDPVHELQLYQTIAGCWPLDKRERADLGERLAAYVQKAARESKIRTSWLEPDEEYEQRLDKLARMLGTSPRFAMQAGPFLRRVAWYGALNSLSMQLLKIASPGVPDLYQGTERWWLRLVDPDNRTPVDLEAHANLLEGLRKAEAEDAPRLIEEMLAGWPDGRVKLFVTARALAARVAAPDLYVGGDYVPVEVRGPKRKHVLAFARRDRAKAALVVVPRLVTSLAQPEVPPTGKRLWKGTTLVMHPHLPARWHDAFTGKELDAAGELAVGEVLGRFPLALLEG